MTYLQRSFDTWYEPLKNIIESEKFINLGKKLHKLYGTRTIYPEKENIFRAFKLCKYTDLKVVILGQDPYHDSVAGIPRATGLAFANNKDYNIKSPSLRNIEKELRNSLKEEIKKLDYTIEDWDKQGILLLNTALTVEKGRANSHKALWIGFIKKIVEFLSYQDPVWILLGNQAKNFKKYIKKIGIVEPIIVEAAHPAAEEYRKNAGFFGSDIFKQVDAHLHLLGQEVKWLT